MFSAGGSGVDFVLRTKDYFSEDIESRFDIVSRDPRGVARSEPVMCSRELRENGPTTYCTAKTWTSSGAERCKGGGP
ncbi:hypothetical protein [Kibdelosporangium aridum]|nr:hypothetical protein [Kibdelosporangium aridum]